MNTSTSIDTPSKERLDGVDRLDAPDSHDKTSHSFNALLQKAADNGSQNDTLVDSGLDVIATNVSKTLLDLDTIYNEIGYSSTEVSIKKAQIFTVLGETIQNFTNSLKREKSNIENECEWLRQQIRIILGIIDDHAGVKTLSEINRGICFNDYQVYEEGFKNEILHKLSVLQTRRDNFYQDSPFNVSNNSVQELTLERNYKEMLNGVPKLSLLTLKNRLNSIFLDVLKVFVKSFKKLIEYSLTYWEFVETVGELETPSNTNILESLPSKAESESHKDLVETFECIIDDLRLKDVRVTSFQSLNSSNDHLSFIISSPNKNKPVEAETSNVESLMNQLRNVNYKIVRVIRNLKLTKLSPEIFSSMAQTVALYHDEFEKRQAKLNGIIEECFDLIQVLGYTEDQLISIQKQFNNSDANEGYFDTETLKFIQSNPREFGLNHTHLNFVDSFVNLLRRIKESKANKLDYYMRNCKGLWSKLEEDEDYINTFLYSNNNLSDSSLNNFKMELNRLFARRSELIDKFIADTKSEIVQLWDMLRYSNDQRAFDFDENREDKEELLNCFETKLAALKQEYESKKDILDSFIELEQLVKDQEFLIESSKDSSRLLSKNSCKILLNEEKLRKRILKRMPKLIETLKSDVVAYNNQQFSNKEKPFMVNNEDFFERILIIESEQLHKNQKRSSPRKESPTKLAKTSPIKTKPASRASPTTNLIGSTKESQQASVRLNRQPVRSVGRSSNRSPVYSINKAQLSFRDSRRPRLAEKSNSLTTSINTSLSQHSELTTAISPIAASMGPLRPLNSPLVPNLGHSISRHSPLRFNQKLSTPIKLMSPYRGNYPDTGDEDNKENQTFGNLNLGLTPIKLSELSRWDKRDTSTPASERKSTFDSSTIIGDDYQQWRDEKIRQFQVD